MTLLRLQSQLVKSVVFFILCAVAARAADIPRTLVSEDESEPIHSAISRKEAWTVDSVRRIRAEAEKRMKEGPWTVTSERPVGITPEPDVHDYFSEAPYWWPNPDNPSGPFIRKDGQVNPNRFYANKAALNSMCDAVFTLGAAAFFLDEPKYGQRAARVIQVWFINPRTRMNPHMQYGQVIRGVTSGGSGILDGRSFLRAIQGMEFLAQTRTWDLKEQAAVRKWFEEYLRWLTTSEDALDEKHSGNSHASWWAAQTAAVASFVENSAAQQMVFKYYADHIFPRQIRIDGGAPREESRARPLSFEAFNLEAFTTVCRIAQVQGVNLWTVQSGKNATIGTVIGYLEPYLSDPRKWSKEQISDFPNDGLYYLAFAGMGLKKPEYIALFRRQERADSAWLSVIDLLVSRWEASAHQTRH
jgi:hypothetical protein